MEGMDILEAWKSIQNERQFLGEGFLSKFDLSSVKI